MEQATKVATVGIDGAVQAPCAQAREADAPWRFRRARGRAGLRSIERVWRRVTAQRLCTPPYTHYGWYALYLDALEYREDEWHFFVVYRGYAPVGVVPVRQTQAKVQGHWLRALELPDHAHVPFADLILPSASASAFVPAFADYLRASALAWDALVLRRIGGRATPRLFAQAPRTIIAPSPRRLCALHAATERTVSSEGFVYTVHRDAAARDAAFDTFLRLDAAAWKGHPGVRGAIVDDSRLIRYYRRLLRLFDPGRSEIGLLTHEGEPIAAQLCLLSAHARYIVKIAHDPSHAARDAVRRLMQALLRRQAADRDARRVLAPVDGAGLGQPYPLYDLYHFNTTRAGRVAYAQMRAAQCLAPVLHTARDLRRAARAGTQTAIARMSQAIGRHMQCP